MGVDLKGPLNRVFGCQDGVRNGSRNGPNMAKIGSSWDLVWVGEVLRGIYITCKAWRHRIHTTYHPEGTGFWTKRHQIWPKHGFDL